MRIAAVFCFYSRGVLRRRTIATTTYSSDASKEQQLDERFPVGRDAARLSRSESQISAAPKHDE